MTLQNNNLPKKEQHARSKNIIRRKIGSWFLNHPNLWTNPLSERSIYRGLTGKFRILPNFIIIGQAKCGTTALYDYLIQHKNILPALWKEIYFFDRYYPRGINWYKANFCFKSTKLFLENFHHKSYITGESTPTYLHHPLTPMRISEHLPNVKLVVLFRNPINRAYSHYHMEKKLGYEKLSFYEALKNEEERLLGEKEKMIYDMNYFSYNWETFSYLKGGHYAELLKNWLEHFSKDNLLILNTEDFNQNPSKIYREVLEFLNLPLQEVSYKKINVGNYTKMDPKIRNELKDYFKPLNQKLYSLVKRDFEWD